MFAGPARGRAGPVGRIPLKYQLRRVGDPEHRPALVSFFHGVTAYNLTILYFVFCLLKTRKFASSIIVTNLEESAWHIVHYP